LAGQPTKTVVLFLLFQQNWLSVLVLHSCSTCSCVLYLVYAKDPWSWFYSMYTTDSL